MKKNSEFQIPKSKMTEEEVSHVAKLARLKLIPDEVKRFSKQLKKTLDYIAILEELETKGVAPTDHVIGENNVFRKDERKPCFTSREVFLAGKSAFREMFKIKAILS